MTSVLPHYLSGPSREDVSWDEAVRLFPEIMHVNPRLMRKMDVVLLGLDGMPIFVSINKKALKQRRSA